MGKPAAKQGDKIVATDTHIIIMPTPGGPVPTPTPMPFVGTISSGCSADVFIEGKPAATVDSVAINQPHIPTGGPFQKPPSNQGKILVGSTGVFINSKPAARQGDQAITCNDPMDMPVGQVVAIGKVFIGETGAGAPKSPAGPPQEPKMVKAKLGQRGKIKKASWGKDKGKCNEPIKMTAELEGFENGTPAIVKVWQEGVDGNNTFLKQIQSEVKDNKMETEWVYEPQIAELGLKSDVEKERGEPKYFFSIDVEGEETRSDELTFVYPLDIFLKDQNGNLLEDVDYTITLSDGTQRRGKFKAGHAIIEDAPYGKYVLEVDGCEIVPEKFEE